MFAIVKEDRFKQSLHRANEVVRDWAPKTSAELSRPTSGSPARIRQETQRKAPLQRLDDFLGAVRAVLREWRRRRNGRLELARLDDRMLRDIGLTRLDAEYEINKPFWRD
jgi:uncharacterized protein YjiS (DUF1127 family)